MGGRVLLVAETVCKGLEAREHGVEAKEDPVRSQEAEENGW